VLLCHGGTDLLVIEPVRDAVEQASGSWTAPTPSSATSPRPSSPRSQGWREWGVRVRWIGHRLHAEDEISVDERRTIAEAHEIAESARHALLHEMPQLASAIIHADPCGNSGIDPHAQNGASRCHLDVPTLPTAIADKPPQ
jgi:hypothetical protein